MRGIMIRHKYFKFDAPVCGVVGYWRTADFGGVPIVEEDNAILGRFTEGTCPDGRKGMVIPDCEPEIPEADIIAVIQAQAAEVASAG